jgi:hypothetical protein
MLNKMENINNYLMIIISLIGFYIFVIIYFKYIQTLKFTPVTSNIPDVQKAETPITLLPEPNVYLTEDTRIQSPLSPPVNPIARKRIIQKNIPANRDLYNSQTYETKDYVLDTPETPNTNQLIYSGGETQLIKIPLQFNDPNQEQLRTQEILITPYNKVKYGTC